MAPVQIQIRAAHYNWIAGEMRNELNESLQPLMSFNFEQICIFPRPIVIRETMWLEESNDLIRSCAQLSSLLGIQKSFSTSDITQLPTDKTFDMNGRNSSNVAIGVDFQMNALHSRHAFSEMALNSMQRCGYMLDTARLDHTSRSCSTWVAVGELASTSQLPSPHGGPSLSINNTSSSQAQLTATNAAATAYQMSQPLFTTADLIRSVNKKVRQNYIRSRLLTTYRAIERLSQSEFNLDQLEAAAVAATVNLKGPGPTELFVPNVKTFGNDKAPELSANAPETIVEDEVGAALANVTDMSQSINVVMSTGNDENADNEPTSISVPIPSAIIAGKSSTVPISDPAVPQLKKQITINFNRNLTIHDIEKERGRPLSKYDRNMMIFNWLHSLDETSAVEEYT